MLTDHLRLLCQLYVRPRRAVAGILDGGSVGVAFLGALLTAAVLQASLLGALIHAVVKTAPPAVARPATPPQASPAPLDDEQMAAVLPMTLGPAAHIALALPGIGAPFSLSLLYAPATLLLLTLFERIGSFGVALRRDFGGLLACTLTCFSAAFLPVALASLALALVHPLAPVALYAAGLLFFLGLMAVTVRTTLGVGWPSAVVAPVLALGAFALQGGAVLMASPFILYCLYQMFGSEAGGILGAFSQRQGLQRYLRACTLNPRDADAHYQLGLIYQRRRQYPEAIARFQQAFAIDTHELDAAFQLGRIAREEGRFEDAIRHLDAVLIRDPKHQGHEAWREAGQVYLATGAFEHACSVLTTFVNARPYDPEGLWALGAACRALGKLEEAKELFRRCVEAARTAPPHRRREVGTWLKKAETDMGRAA